MDSFTKANPVKKIMLLVPICALVLLAVSVYLIGQSSENIRKISANVSQVSDNFDASSTNAFSLAADMKTTTIDDETYAAFPQANFREIITSRNELVALRQEMNVERDNLFAERDNLNRDTTITISLSMFFVVASFIMAFFIPGSLQDTMRKAEDKSSE